MGAILPNLRNLFHSLQTGCHHLLAQLPTDQGLQTRVHSGLPLRNAWTGNRVTTTSDRLRERTEPVRLRAV